MHDEHYCYHTGLEGKRGEQGPAGGNGYSPTVEIERVRRGHEIKITDLDGEHVFTVRDGFDGGGLLARDGDGNCWYGPRFEDDGDAGLLVEDGDGNVWYYPVGEGAAGDAAVDDEDDGAWYIPECGEGPQGPKGEKGDRGDTGATGPQGEKGDRGDAAIAVKTLSLSTTWTGSGPYTQTVTISGYTITANSKVDLQPDAAAIAQLVSDGVNALYVANNNGTLTAYAVGAAPTAALTVQCTITEVTV